MTQHQDNNLQRQYATDENLRVRQETHDKFTVPNISFAEWVIDRIDWQGGDRVLDVGCGNGLYYNKMMLHGLDIEYVGLDLNGAMVANHPLAGGKGRITVANVEKIPFPDNHFDLVMANHVLHHVSDIEPAIKEIRRVLKPQGVLAVATNSVNTMPELQVLMRRAIALVTRSGVAAQIRAPQLPTDNFALENGTRVLARNFYAVVRHDLPSALVFPQVEPAMAYLDSTRTLREGGLPDDVVWEDVMMIMRQQISQLIKHLGELVINKQSGVLIASDKGGFIEEFQQRQHNAESK